MKHAPIGSESFRKLNPHLFPKNGAEPLPVRLKRIKQSRDQLNKLELEFQARLYYLHRNAPIYAQAIRFRLGNGIWYKPDFVVAVNSSNWHCYEVKGPKLWRGGVENLKVAASLYPKLVWILVWKDRLLNDWKEQTMLP